MSGAKLLFDDIVTRGSSYFEHLIGKEVEREILDFKMLATDPANGTFGKKEKELLSIAIGGFYNTDGGIIVWGVDCRKGPNGEDVVQGLYPFPNLTAFKSELYEYTSRAVLPPVAGVFHDFFESSTEPGKGFAVSYIPKSDGLPVQSAASGLNRAIYFRSGSSFEVMSQSMLADRFGRRPQPNLKLAAWVRHTDDPTGVYLTIGLYNAGRGLADHSALEISEASGVPNLIVSPDAWMRPSPSHSETAQTYQGNSSRFLVEYAPFLIYPGRFHPVFFCDIPFGQMRAYFGDDFQRPLKIPYKCYAEGFVGQGELSFTLAEIQSQGAVVDE